jgi:hypothetical protein
MCQKENFSSLLMFADPSHNITISIKIVRFVRRVLMISIMNSHIFYERFFLSETLRQFYYRQWTNVSTSTMVRFVSVLSPWTALLFVFCRQTIEKFELVQHVGRNKSCMRSDMFFMSQNFPNPFRAYFAQICLMDFLLNLLF